MRIHQSRLRAVEDDGFDPRAQFREQVLQRLSAHALRTGGAAHDINNPCASVTANLSYLALRADDLANEASAMGDDAAKARLMEISSEFKEVTTESSDAMKRIVEISRGLCQPDLRRSRVKSVVDVSEHVRRAVRLVMQCAPDIHIQCRGDTIHVEFPPTDLGDMVLEMLVAALEDGAPDADGQPISLNIEMLENDGNGVLKVTRHGPSQGTPTIEGELARGVDIACSNDASITVESSDTQYAIAAQFAPRTT